MNLPHTKYQVTLTLTEPMLGTISKNKEVYAKYIATKAPKGTDIEEEIETVEEIEEKGWTGFHSDSAGIFIFDYMIRGFLKAAGTVLRTELKVSNLKSKIDNYVFVTPRRIRPKRWAPTADGNVETEPSEADGALERPLRAMTALGPRNSLMRSDFVNAGTELSFELLVLRHPEMTEALLQSLFSYGALVGLGQWRNGSYGRFTFTLEKLG